MPTAIEARAALESQIRDSFGRAAYSHKCHEKSADVLVSRLSRLKVLQIAVAAITSGSLITSLFAENQSGVLIGALLSTLQVGMNTYLKDHDLAEVARRHSLTAARLWIIREKFLSLLVDLKSEATALKSIHDMRDSLNEQLLAIHTEAPRTDHSAYKKAQEALKIGNELTFTSHEIDKLLPDALRLPGGR